MKIIFRCILVKFYYNNNKNCKYNVKNFVKLKNVFFYDIYNLVNKFFFVGKFNYLLFFVIIVLKMFIKFLVGN